MTLAHAECYAQQVYEHLVFEPHRHVSLASLAGMRERCLRVCSAGKTFSFTAWKVRHQLWGTSLLLALPKLLLAAALYRLNAVFSSVYHLYCWWASNPKSHAVRRSILA
jgi:hypothetical protein